MAAVEESKPAWTDGVTVFVDADVDPTRRLASLVVQSSLIGAGSLDPTILTELLRRPALCLRYLTVEAQRALSELEPLLPLSVRGLVDHDLADRSRSPADSLAIAASRENLAEPREEFGTIRPRLVQSPTTRNEDGDPAQGYVPRGKGPRQLHELDREDDVVGPVGELLSSPVGGGGGIGRLLRRLFGERRSSGGGHPGADSPTHWSLRATRGSGLIAVSTVAAPVPEGSWFGRRGFRYPEWDSHKRRYKPHWCTVEEVEPEPSLLQSFAVPDTLRLRRALERLGTDLERHRRQLQGDDVDVDATVESFVELKAGSAPDEAVYIDTLRRRRDLAVLVLLDVSGSAGEPSATGVAVHEHQRAAAAALVSALYELGDRVALYGFRSQGRAAVRLLRVKRFRDDLDQHTIQRLGGFVPGAYTRLGAAIRHAVAILEKDSGTSRRLLAVISDGLAYDHGYEPLYGEADSRRALAEARRRGIGSLCLSVGARTDVGALRRVFGTAAHASIPNTDVLPGIVGPLFRSALGSAELQRKVTQNYERTKGRRGTERGTA